MVFVRLLFLMSNLKASSKVSLVLRSLFVRSPSPHLIEKETEKTCPEEREVCRLTQLVGDRAVQE